MKKERLTLEELESLKPTPYNMIELVCDDGYYVADMRKIKVFAFVDDRIYFIKTGGGHSYTSSDILSHYPSFKQEREKVQLFECLDETFNLSYMTLDGRYYNRATSVLVQMTRFGLHQFKPNGQSIWIYTDTGEIVQD